MAGADARTPRAVPAPGPPLPWRFADAIAGARDRRSGNSNDLGPTSTAPHRLQTRCFSVRSSPR